MKLKERYLMIRKFMKKIRFRDSHYPSSARTLYGAFCRGAKYLWSLRLDNKRQNLKEVIIKPVGAICNLRCKYCYYTPDNVSSSKLQGQLKTQIMTETTLERIISEVATNYPYIQSFVWHGGEPLLAGINFYQNVVDIQSKHLKNNHKIRNIIQSNGTLLNEEWISFFKDNNFEIGLSIDGTKEIHDSYRQYPDGHGSFTDVIRSISKMRSHGLDFGVLAVVNNEFRGKEQSIFDFFLDKGIFRFSLEPCVSPVLSLDSSVFTNIMKEFFDIWLKSGSTTIEIRLFEVVIQSLMGLSPGLCFFAGTCDKYISIDPQGNVWPCDKPFNLIDETGDCFGNIMEDNLPTILCSKPAQEFANKIRVMSRNCSNCKWYFLCHGGCPYWRVFRDEEKHRENYCKAYKEIFSHITQRVESILNNF